MEVVNLQVMYKAVSVYDITEGETEPNKFLHLELKQRRQANKEHRERTDRKVG